MLLSQTSTYAVRAAIHLAEHPEAARVPVGEIVAAVEPRRFDRRCLLGRPECSNADPCPAHDRWESLAHAITGFLDETTLDDLRRRERRRRPKRARARKAATGTG